VSRPTQAVGSVADLVEICDRWIASTVVVPDSPPDWVLRGEDEPPTAGGELQAARGEYAGAVSAMQRRLMFGGLQARSDLWRGLLQLADEVGALIRERSTVQLESLFVRDWHPGHQHAHYRFGMIMSGQDPPVGAMSRAYVERAVTVAVTYHVRRERCLPSVRRFVGPDPHCMLMMVVMLAWLRSLIDRDLFAVRLQAL
jgi:hypothetical protein